MRRSWSRGSAASTARSASPRLTDCRWVRARGRSTRASCSISWSHVDPILAARAQLIDALDRCKETHGSDPAATAAIGENALAPTAPAWPPLADDALPYSQNPHARDDGG